jgi:hypothetical protein
MALAIAEAKHRVLLALLNVEYLEEQNRKQSGD